jgi:TPR repeat protein
MARSEVPRSLAVTSAGASAQMLFHLGMLYYLGREVAQDYVAAQKWLTLAALRGSLEARRYRCNISRAMTAGQIAEAQRQTRAWIDIN